MDYGGPSSCHSLGLAQCLSIYEKKKKKTNSSAIPTLPSPEGSKRGHPRMTRTSTSPRAEINPTSVLQAQLNIRPRRSRKFPQEACSAAGCTILRKETRDWEARESKTEGEELHGNRKAGVWGERGGQSQAGPGGERRGKRGEERSRKRGDGSGSLLPTPSLMVASTPQGQNPQVQ